MTSDFTILMCIRGTDREKKFMEKSIPSIIKLNSNDVIFGIDEGTDISVKEQISSICKKYNFTNYRIIEVPRDKQWKMQMTHVVWVCYNKAKHDKIFHCDVDTILQKSVLIGYDVVGKNNVVTCSFTTKLLVRNFGEWRREFFYRKRVRTNDDVFSGVYWIYRPFYFLNVKKDEYMKLHNGIDTFMYKTVHANNTHTIVTKKEIGSHQMDLASGDYPWHQFMWGMWWYAYYNKKNESKPVKHRNLFSPISSEIVKTTDETNKVTEDTPNIEPTIKAKVDILSTIEHIILIPYYLYHKSRGTLHFGQLKVSSWKNANPGIIDGYKWAQENKDSDIIKQASTCTLEEWGYLGGKVLKTTGKQFEREDGTGFV